MKIWQRNILALIILLLAVPVMGQQDTVVVGYGETFETIAYKRGISVDELREANPQKETCYVGMKLVVPRPEISPVGDTAITSAVVLRADSLLLEAKAISFSGKYKKAIKLYNKVLNMRIRTPYAYAGRGACYYYLKKYKKAKEDLRSAVYSDQLARVEKDWCEEALEDIEKEMRAKRERRNEVWANIGLSVAAAAAVTATAYAASEQAKMQNQYYQSTMQSSPSRGSSHLSRSDQIIAQSDANINQMMARGQAQLNQMTQSAMIQLKQGQERMNRAFKEQLEWMSDFNKKNGRSPTEFEIDQWYAANYPDLLESRILARGNLNTDSQSEDKETEVEYKGELSPEQYQQAYKRWEHVVEGWFSNLTTGGYKYEDKDGNIKGKTVNDMKANIYVGNQMGLKNAQREMKKIRLEAEKYGVYIAESRWETATSGF